MIFETNRKFTLFGDLHLNSSEYAQACEEAGADAVIFHLNHDSAGGSRFGGLEIEEESIKEALSVLKVPSGITIGDARTLLPDEWEAVVKLGFSFVNMFAHQFPTFVWEDERVQKLVSIGPGYILEQVKGLSEFDSLSGIVAALTPNQGLGLPLTLLDITTLKLVAKLAVKPVFIPTQRSIRQQDLKILKDVGCNGLLLNGSLYGDSPESCREQVICFREEISRLSQAVPP